MRFDFKPDQRRWAIAFAALSAYVLLFFLLYPLSRESNAALVILPVAVIAWMGGARLGVLAGILSFPLNTLLLNLAEIRADPWTVVVQSGGGPGSVAIVLVGFIVGLLHDQRDQIARQLVGRQQVESALSESEQRYRALLDSAQRQAQELLLLDRVRQALTRELELPLVFRTVVEGIAQTFGYTQVSLYLLEGDVLVLQYQVGYDHVIDRIPITQGITGRVVRSQRPVLLEDVRGDPAFLEAIEGITSEICVPLFDQGQVAGVLNVESTHGVRLSEADLRLMTALVEQVGIALGRARLYSDVRESEQRFRQLAENIEQVFWLEDAERSHLYYVSPTYETIWGRTPQSLYERPQSWFDAIHPDDRERVLAAQVRQISGEYDIEYRVTRPDGSLRWVWSRAFPIRDEHGQVHRIAGIAEDITERKVAEEALRQNEERFKLMAWATKDAVWDRDLQTNQVWWGEGLQKIFHYSSETSQMNFEWWFEHIHPEDRAKVDRTVHQALEGGMEFWSKEYRFQRKDGTYADIMDRGYIIRDDTGKPYRMIGAMMDITERNQALNALQEWEDRFRKTLDSLSEGFQIISFDWRYLYVNEEIARQARKSRQELEGHTMMEMYPGIEETPMFSALRHCMDERIIHRLENEFTYPDGSKKWFELTIQPASDGIFILSTDITERKHLESSLFQANEGLRQFLNELERHNREIALLNEMSRLLQACASVEEAYRIIADLSDQMFPHTAGALYLINSARTLVSAVASWGELPSAQRIFAPNDCWALRRGRTHPLSVDQVEEPCLHLTEPLAAVSYCLPMQVQGEILGLLHVQSRDKENLDETKRQLAYTVIEQAGLALSNLRLREALREQSIRDPLTGLYNRRYMEEVLRQQLSRVTRQLHPLGIIMIDIDHFKPFNDTHGHSAGDELLGEIGRFLQAHIRGEDIACRYGGEEFMLIMPDIRLEVAQQRAEHLRREVRQLRVQRAGQASVVITLSLGVAIYPQHGRTIEAVLRAADEALYRAKREGRDRVVIAE